MSSLRKPKRITIRGDDEREYMFLIKGGEDLRMDQRVEQVNAYRYYLGDIIWSTILTGL